MTQLQAKGWMVTLTFDGEWITINRRFRGAKRIHVSQVTAVQFMPAHAPGIQGFIEFSFPGAKEKNSASRNRAAHNENAAIFLKRRQQEFQAIRDAVEYQIMANVRQQPWPTHPQQY